MDLVLKKLKKKSLSGERFRKFSKCIEQRKQNYFMIDQTGVIIKKYLAKRRKLRKNLNIGEKVLVLAERIKKKSAPGKFCKQSVQNITYFNKEKIFSIRKKQNIDKIDYYWLIDLQTNRNVKKGFQRTELFAIKSNFSM